MNIDNIFFISWGKHDLTNDVKPKICNLKRLSSKICVQKVHNSWEDINSTEDPILYRKYTIDSTEDPEDTSGSGFPHLGKK